MFENQALTPQRAVEAILENTKALIKFIQVCRTSFDISLGVERIVNDTRNAKGQDFDFAAWTPIVIKASSGNSPIVEHITNYSYLYGLATVRLWTGLESGVNDLALALLGRDERWKDLPAVRQSKLKLGDFLSAPSKDQMTLLLDALLTETKAKGQPGIGRLEATLDTVECGGGVKEVLRRTILELAETRHVLVHRRSFADDKFKGRCPWVPIWGNGVVMVREIDFHRFGAAVMVYIFELMLRLSKNGWLDGVEVDLIAYRDEMLENLVRLDAKPRPQTTGSIPDDMVLMLQECQAENEPPFATPIV